MSPEAAEKILNLIRKAQTGDAAAKETLAEELLRELAPDAKRLLRGNNAGLTLRTDDLIQDVALKLLAGGLLKCPTESRQLCRWLHTVMHNKLRSYIRYRRADRRDARRRADFDELVDYYGQRLDGELDDFLDALDRLKALSPLQEEIARLCIFSELTLGGIAEQLGMPVGQAEEEWALAHARLLAEMKVLARK
jgi:RNA polymerase sigma factor (sigma-70 family)